MSGDDYGHLAYLVLLGCVISLWFFAQNRQGLGKSMQQALAWGLIFIGVIAAIGLWDDIRSTVRPQQNITLGANRIELPRQADGHYYITLEINNAPIKFVVDTGASGVVLTHSDARAAGLDPASLAYVGRANTANGMVRTAPVRLDRVTIGDITDINLRAWVNEGEMDQSLLGMSYLQRFAKIEITSGSLILTR